MYLVSFIKGIWTDTLGPLSDRTGSGETSPSFTTLQSPPTPLSLCTYLSLASWAGQPLCLTIVNRTQCPKPNLTAYSIGSGVAVLSSDPTDPTVMPTSVRNTLGPLYVSKVLRLLILATLPCRWPTTSLGLSALLLTVDETGGRYAPRATWDFESCKWV